MHVRVSCVAARRLRAAWLMLAVGVVTVALATSAAPCGESAEYQKLLSDKSDALVTVRFVLKLKMGGMMAAMGDQESENEITGVMIDPQGVVLCSNTQLGGFTAMMSRFMGSMGGNISATPTDLRVLVGDDTEGVEAKLIARDSELDLAWVRIKDPGGKTYRHVDLTAAAKPEIGQRIVVIRRLGKHYARSAVITEGHIGGITTKPRDLYIPSIEVAMAYGMPVYFPDGRLLGVLVMQLPEVEDVAPNPMAMLSQMGNMQEMMAGFILPAAEVAKATRRAMESAEAEAD